MDSYITTALHAVGLDSFLPLLLALHGVASATDALLPQPAAGSHWLLPRKLISLAAMNFLNASNASQPALITWAQRIASMLVAILPQPAAPASIPTKRDPLMPQMQQQPAAASPIAPLFPAQFPPQFPPQS